MVIVPPSLLGPNILLRTLSAINLSLCSSIRMRDQASLTVWNGVLLEKLTVTQLVNKYPVFYGLRIFIAVFTRTRHWTLSWARWIQSTPFHLISVRSILMSSSHLRLDLAGGFFTAGFPTETLYGFSSLPCVLHAPPLSFSLIWSP
jgi:hypothetical protein